MILEGQLGPFRAADLLQFLGAAGVTGQLAIEAGPGSARAYFHGGELIYASREGPRERLGDRLLRLGLVSPSQLAGVELRLELPGERRRIGQILLEAGSLDRETLQRVVREQIRESVADILELRRGRFRFHENRLPHGEDILLDVGLDLLLQGGPAAGTGPGPAGGPVAG